MDRQDGRVPGVGQEVQRKGGQRKRAVRRRHDSAGRVRRPQGARLQRRREDRRLLHNLHLENNIRRRFKNGEII